MSLLGLGREEKTGNDSDPRIGIESGLIVIERQVECFFSDSVLVLIYMITSLLLENIEINIYKNRVSLVIVRLHFYTLSTAR